jgi:hypothetical protein
MREALPGKDEKRKDLGAGLAGSRERKEALRSSELVTNEKDSTSFSPGNPVESVDEQTWNDTILAFASIRASEDVGKGDE